MKPSILILSIALLFQSCGSNKTESIIGYAEPAVSESPAAGASSQQELSLATDKSKNGEGKEHEEKDEQKNMETKPVDNGPVQKTEIIRNASIRFQVKDVEKSHRKIEELLKQNKAYFGSDNKASDTYQVDNNLVIRVPAQDMDKLMNEIMEESIFSNYKNISAEDVTAQFFDTETRLKTKKEVEQRYLALLKQAAKVADILEVEEKLGAIREEIEATEGRLKLMKDQVAYSTISLNIYQKLDYTPQPQIGFISNVEEAFVRGWRGLVEFFIGLIRVWPFVIVLSAGIIFMIRKISRRKNVAGS